MVWGVREKHEQNGEKMRKATLERLRSTAKSIDILTAANDYNHAICGTRTFVQVTSIEMMPGINKTLFQFSLNQNLLFYVNNLNFKGLALLVGSSRVKILCFSVIFTRIMTTIRLEFSFFDKMKEAYNINMYNKCAL